VRVPLEPLRRAFKVINHGPTTLISARHGDRTNVMAAAWVMAIDFDPPKIAAVIAEDTLTRELIEASGEFCVSVPTVEMADLTYELGNVSGKELDKLEKYGVKTAPASKIAAPLIEGCAGWLECRVIPEPTIQESYDLFIAEVVAAWVDDRDFKDGDWRFEDPSRRTIHHLAKGVFFATGERVEARRGR
jgi:flavin reductase (DIM6/NTAB) family NADH-FMN oxidoreductase RutF